MFEIEEQKVALFNDLMVTQEELDNLWEFHPDNSKGVNVKKRYEELLLIKQEVQEELDCLT